MMELKTIIESLTDTHYDESFSFYVFDQNQKKTDCIVERNVSDLFSKEDWENGIELLNRLQSHGKNDLCFNNFWEHFLVEVDTNLNLQKDFVCQNSLNVEKYLKYILVLLGYGADVQHIQDDRKAMSEVSHVSCRKVNLFAGNVDAVHMLHTLRCYGNWWRHGYTQTPDNDPEKTQDAMIIPHFKNNKKDFDFLDEHVRLILVLLLMITKYQKKDLEEKLSPVTSALTLEDTFDEEKFLDIYFNKIKDSIERKLQEQAIKELKAENELGYFEHSFRFSHSSQSAYDEEDETETETETEKKIRLSQFRKSSANKTNIILGMPGAGKTTALELLACQCIKQYFKRGEEERAQSSIPIIIPLRSISIRNDSSDVIVSAINEHVGLTIIDKDNNYRSSAFKYIFNAIEEGRVVLFFDGLNEINPSDVKAIINSLVALLGRMPENSRVFITGRKYEYEGSEYAKELETVSDVGVWHLEELSFQQIEGFLSPNIRSQIINGQIIELFSSPLNLRLFLNFINKRKKDLEESSLGVPLNRGEMLESFLSDTLEDNDIKPYHANLLLKYMATRGYGRQWEADKLNNCIENQPKDLVSRLAAVNILSISPARSDMAEQVSFSIDTFQEFYRAKQIIDRLRSDSKLSLYSLDDEDCRFNPESSEDFETLKLIFELGSSPLCYKKSKAKIDDADKRHALEFSARIAKDFLNPQKRFEDPEVRNRLDINTEFKATINPRLLTLCKLTRNVPFSEDLKFKEGQPSDNGKNCINAKDIAELLILNNLKWFRVKHPETIVLNKLLPEYTYLEKLLTAAATIGGKRIWDEIISTYWLFTLGIIVPYDYGLNKEDSDEKKVGRERNNRMNASYGLLLNLSYNCRDYIYLYNTIHNLHIYFIKRKRTNSAFGISAFLYQYFLCFLPDYAKKHLLHHISQLYDKSRHDLQLASDINTLLCYIGDSQLLEEKFIYESNGLIRIKELRYILRNYADMATQRFVLSPKFFAKLQQTSKDENLKSFTIRYFLFRLGFTPIMKKFLFQDDGLKQIPENEIEGIMDMIPVKSLPKEYIEKNYDTDISELLIKEGENDQPGTKIDYEYLGTAEDNYLVSVLDIDDDSLVGVECHIEGQKFRVVSDRYYDTIRLYCSIKATYDNHKLLPEKGYITTENNDHKIAYYAASPNTELNFYLYGDSALELYTLFNEHNKLFIGETECSIVFPEQKHSQLVYRNFRVLELNPLGDTAQMLPYAGEITTNRTINKTAKAGLSMASPERYEFLSHDMNLKTDNIRYRVFGQNKSFLWVITEKIVTSADLLIGNLVVDKVTKNSYKIHSIRPHNIPYMEFWFKVSQKVSLPSYGTFGRLDKDGVYNLLPYCFITTSDDGLNLKLRVSYEDIQDLTTEDIYNASYLLGHIPMQLISADKIYSNRRHSMWTLKKKGMDCNVAEGIFYVPGKQKNQKTILTISGETRSTIKHMPCTVASYDKDSNKLYLLAKKSKGSIGNGSGDHNLLKGLYLSLPKESSARLFIEKESEFNPMWVRRFNIRFDIRLPRANGIFMINDTKINFAKQEDDWFWLWTNCNSEISAADDLETILKEKDTLNLIFDDGNDNEYRILSISEDKSVTNYSLVIQTHCSPAVAEIIRPEKIFILQAMAPVLNMPVFPRTFRGLYPKYSVRYHRDVKKPGSIIIPRPVSILEADSVVLDKFSKWNVHEISLMGVKYLRVCLRDQDGRIPKIISDGFVNFKHNNQQQLLWYRDISDLIDSAHPEKYHSEICDKLLEEILNEVTELDNSIVNFFVQKSRASDLVTNLKLLRKVNGESQNKMSFNICRVLGSDVLKGLEAYSALHGKKVISSDTMPESHNGRAFQWQDLVLMEKNHRLTLTSNLPRYSCLGYKRGFVLSVSDTPNFTLRKKVVIITDDYDEESYCFFYDARNESIHFSPGENVDFFATINYNNEKMLAAENVRSLGTYQPTILADFIGRKEENNQIIFSFDNNGETLEVSINEKATQRNAKYSSLEVGNSYPLIKRSRIYLLDI